MQSLHRPKPHTGPPHHAARLNIMRDSRGAQLMLNDLLTSHPAGVPTLTMTNERTFDTRIDLRADARLPLIDLLNQQLADTCDLFSQAKQAHWNVKGAQFYQLHELFDRLAGELAGFADVIAERVTALGGLALGTVRMAAQRSRLSECDVHTIEGMATVDALATRFAALAASTRTAIQIADEHGDAATADLLTELSRALDKSLWFLDAHLQR
jgi:starvation-inducible DNA-binding protein